MPYSHSRTPILTLLVSLMAVLLVILLLLLASLTPVAAQSRLALNPLPRGYHGPAPTVVPALPGPVLRVVMHVVNPDGRPHAHAQLRVEGSPQALWADDQGMLVLLVNLERGPLHLTVSSYGYDDATATIARPEDNNLVFELFPTPPAPVQTGRRPQQP